jgi:DNA polymerase-3 subunit alpha
MDRFGWEKTAYILAIGTSAEKGTIDDIGRGLDLIYKKQGTPSPYTLDKVAKIKKEYEESQEDTRSKYPELFYYFDGMVNTVVSQSMHPAGIVASPISLYDNYGIFYNKDGMRILQIDMEEVHEVSLVKYDILGLKNIEVIKDCCEYANTPYPKAHTINFNDDKVWEDMISCPVGIFQFESKFASELLKNFKPHKINDLSLVNASLRPSGESYRDNLIARIPNKNPSKIIDDLLADNNGYLVFQEDTIAFLQNICGLSGSDSDNIRRAIGRKQKDRLDKAMPQILEGYCNKSNKLRKEAEKEAKAFLQIIEDSSNYQFGKNHSTGYSIIGYYCAYYRYYYPLEFATAYLNNANNENDIIEGHELLKHKNITLKEPKFRYAKDNYTMDKENNAIYKGIASIKFLNSNVADGLYSLKDNQYDSFIDLLIDIKNISINSRQLNILIMLGFFSEFGGRKYLLDVVEIFNNIYGKKQFKRDKLPCKEEFIRQFATTETEKMFKNIDTLGLCKFLINNIPNEELPISEIIKAEIEYYGSPVYINKELEDNTLIILEVNTKYTPKLKMYSPISGNTETVKISKKDFKKQPLEVGDIILVFNIYEKHKKTKDKDGKWIDIPNEYEYWIDDYKIIEQ